MEHRWFYEIIGFVGMAPVILLTLRLNGGTSMRRVWMGESGLEDVRKKGKVWTSEVPTLYSASSRDT